MYKKIEIRFESIIFSCLCLRVTYIVSQLVVQGTQITVAVCMSYKPGLRISCWLNERKKVWVKGYKSLC